MKKRDASKFGVFEDGGLQQGKHKQGSALTHHVRYVVLESVISNTSFLLALL